MHSGLAGVVLRKRTVTILFIRFKNKAQGFPGGAAVENPPADAGNTGSSRGLGRSHMPRSN